MITSRFHRNGRAIINGCMTGGGRSGASSGYTLIRGVKSVCGRAFIYPQPRFITLCPTVEILSCFLIPLWNRYVNRVTRVRHLRKSEGGLVKKF